MKIFIGIVLSVVVMQALAMPTMEENMNAPEAMPIGGSFVDGLPYQDSEVVQQFRADIEYWFVRFQNLYDRMNAATRNYRFNHVTLITTIYNALLTAFGDSIEAVRQASWELSDLIAERRETLGQNNACLNGVVTRQGTNSGQVSSTIQSCALYANTTMSQLLTNNFYPAFANIQNTISGVNVAVVDALSRGNVLQDEEAIIEYLRAGYSVAEFQWLTAVSQLLRWETNRFQVNGLFLADEMSICMAPAVIRFITVNAELLTDTRNC